MPNEPPPNDSTTGARTRFAFLRSRRFFAIAVVITICGIWLFSGGAADYAASLAKSALARRDTAAAQTWLGVADWFRGSEAEVAFLKARVSRRQGDIKAAKKWLAVARALGTDRASVHREMILTFAQVGRMRDAEPRLNELLANPGDDGLEIFEAFVKGFVLNNDLEKADSLITTWIADFPEDSLPWISRAQIMHTIKQPTQAEENFREAIKRDPESLDGLTGLGTVLLTQHQPDEALNQFRRCLEFHADQHGPRVGAARALVMLGKMDEALDELNQILGAEPDHDIALLERGKLHLAEDRYDAAVKDLEYLCQLKIGGAEHRYQLAIALRAAGREDEAQKHFSFAEEGQTELKRADELAYKFPGNSGNVATRVEIGRIHLVYGNAVKGLAELNSVLNEAPNNRPALKAMATYYRECSEFEKNFVRLANLYQARFDSIPESSVQETPETPSQESPAVPDTE